MLGRKKLFAWAADAALFIIGGAIYAVAVILFLSGNEISPGGLTGISTMLNYLYGLPVGTVVFILNTAVSTVVISITLDIAEELLPELKINPVLAAVFGGLLMGLSISMFMLRGSTTGGVDIIAMLINQRFPHLTVGRLMLASDAFIVAFSALVYKNIESALYSVIALYASSRIMDVMLYGADKGKIVYIVTENSSCVAEKIMSIVRRGITVIDVTGAYTGRKLKMLMCTVRRNEVSAVCKTARDNDKGAFIVVAEAGDILGEGFKRES